jgi:hypothetical protein
MKLTEVAPFKVTSSSYSLFASAVIDPFLKISALMAVLAEPSAQEAALGESPYSSTEPSSWTSGQSTIPSTEE